MQTGAGANGFTNFDDVRRLKCVIDAIRNPRRLDWEWIGGLTDFWTYQLNKNQLNKKAGISAGLIYWRDARRRDQYFAATGAPLPQPKR